MASQPAFDRNVAACCAHPVSEPGRYGPTRVGPRPVCRTCPGSTAEHEWYVTPMTSCVAGSMEASTSALPQPFCKVTAMVSGPSRAATASAALRVWCDLTNTSAMSTGPTEAGSLVTGTATRSGPALDSTVRPCSRTRSTSSGETSTTVTSHPAAAASAANAPPIAPPPTTAALTGTSDARQRQPRFASPSLITFGSPDTAQSDMRNDQMMAYQVPQNNGPDDEYRSHDDHVSSS